MDAKRIVAGNVKKYRLALGLSLRKFATISDCELSQITRIENGEVNTTVNTIFKLANALGIKPAQLLEE
ncbi:Helix-turn-helix [Pedobacter sp. ok626]|uniref:helix-turn-helix domain-containing protein n=1 Tax=Pedobacter sp. ok626 TaxID=1761882 RepID=UPI00088B8ED5|nr:helix-turn-helix transcriptional regulator [Pedobacter sp. ok626]SDJ80317.1 Helix-turn-helix [Pedobacter sp. ok626]